MTKDQLQQALKEGKTQAQIAREFNISRQRVQQLILSHGLKNVYLVARQQKQFAKVEERRQKFGIKDKLDKAMYSELKRRFRVKKGNAKRDGIEFTITFNEIMWPSHCPLLDERLDYFSTSGWWVPTFDRIDPTKGYVSGNVCIISRRANSIKSDYTPEEAPQFFEKYFAIVQKILPHVK